MSATDSLSTLKERTTKMEQLSDQLFEKGFMIWDNFIPKHLTKDLNQKAQYLYKTDHFKKAGVGASYMNQIDKDVRGDYIHWISNTSNDRSIQSFISELHFFIDFLNEKCFAGVRDFEMHFAIYPEGSRYEKHIDQLKINGQRMFSTICYLNNNWTPASGGELRLHFENTTFDVEPIGGRLIVLRSDMIPHEVLPTQEERVALTGWLLNQPKTLTFV